MANAQLTNITLPSGTTYDLVDSGARDLIAAINNWTYVVCTNAANTPKDVEWGEGASKVTGTLVASADTMYKIYLVPSSNGENDSYDEYVTVNPSGSTYNWEMFGNTALPDLSGYAKIEDLGDLAWKDTASGTVTVPKTFSSSTTTTVATSSTESVSVSGTTAGSVSETKSAVEITPAATGTSANKYTPAGSNAASAVSGSCSVTPEGSITIGSGTANYTPAGSNASSSVSGSCSVTPSGAISVGSGATNYTPAGSVAVTTAGDTTTIKNPTAKTVVTDMDVAAPSSTAATGELAYYEVSGTTLTLKKIVETTGDSITTTNTTVKTGDAAYGFSGTGVDLKFTGSSSEGTITGTAEGQTFTGTGADLEFTGSASAGTISGTAAAQTFTGTDTYFKTASNVLTGASFEGAAITSTGSVSVPATFTSSTTTTVASTEDKTVTVS